MGASSLFRLSRDRAVGILLGQIHAADNETLAQMVKASGRFNTELNNIVVVPNHCENDDEDQP